MFAPVNASTVQLFKESKIIAFIHQSLYVLQNTFVNIIHDLYIA